MRTPFHSSARLLAPMLALALSALAACDTIDFAAPDLVNKDRVLAGRVVIASEPSRTTPTFGEQASYQLLVGGPGADATWSYMLAVCRFRRDENGAPYCDPSEPPLAFTGTTPLLSLSPELPHVDFVVPPREALREDERELLVQGMLCPAGPFDDKILAAIAAQDYSALAAGRNPCADKSLNGVVLASSFPIERTLEDRNHAPLIEAISCSRLTDDLQDVLPGTPWIADAPTDAPAEGCVGQGFPEVARSDRIGIQLQLDPAARESYPDPSPVPGAPPTQRTEIPRVEGLASAGKFEIVRDNQLREGQLLQLEWLLPKQAKVLPTGLLVRFWFLATDDRFGDTQATSWQTRFLCVVGTDSISVSTGP